MVAYDEAAHANLRPARAQAAEACGRAIAFARDVAGVVDALVVEASVVDYVLPQDGRQARLKIIVLVLVGSPVRGQAVVINGRERMVVVAAEACEQVVFVADLEV